MDKFIQCPFCEKDLIVNWGSLCGNGKRCYNCKKVIHRHDIKVIYK